MTEVHLKTPPSKEFLQEALQDFRLACMSREASLNGRREVLSGKAKFGIFGAGKELAQLAMARVFQQGDFRSGYYRDQTFVLATGLATVEQLYAQLYADPENDPFSAGRQMNSHFASPLINAQGEWLNHTTLKNISADISPTGGQMARALGLALASKKYRECADQIGDLANNFSVNGNEVSFCTIGDASTSEGVFWETLNAAGVQQLPLAVFVWDDGYGISVPREYQTTKGSISEALKGFHPTEEGQNGVRIVKVKGWDYLGMRQAFAEAIALCREAHSPCLIHVEECTQPQGHSTSGSHERYKDENRLNWEKEQDGIEKLQAWLIEMGVATEEELKAIRKEIKKEVKAAIRKAWSNFNDPIQQELKQTQELLRQAAASSGQKAQIEALATALGSAYNPVRKDMLQAMRKALRLMRGEQSAAKNSLAQALEEKMAQQNERYASKLYSEGPKSALKQAGVPAQYAEDAELKSGYEILNACFDLHLQNNPQFFAFGEDVGQIGDVNQGFMNMQEKYGEARVFDTGIREWTIIGQAIGMAMRGLRPLAEIQYLDYLIYAISALSDDLATLQYRSNGQQKAPAIIRTRGHRLEGIWHSGSPIGLLLNSLRGIYILTPRNMTQAAGFYNTMLDSDDPCLMIECLNGYRLKEKMPSNLAEFKLPLGVPEVLEEGQDVTLLTYGSSVRIAEEAMEELKEMGISVELIDAQTLLPFDINHMVAESVKKTNRLVILDEDLPGGASAYLLQQLMVEQKAYYHLDSEPLTISAKAVRPGYGSDADYSIKPSADDVVEQIYALMREARPTDFPPIY
ncbi:alpha-ketoacid dehydrogenase subunit alpha/beta [Saprospira grandis]|uniref:3-methyl-2-oxobutanoate dehydrogenase (2-methylpropanoyl-transferring) n=1 Tax=Saprospira grandis (strain Lewin) TaxID=984262 RepID=H6L458_SAPGL|nr:thiamine pyrophosphate-dependent enzyme [Saprospira grandis]AFC25042.1 transketolase domain protein [Saprospira grandis str. Lewin]